MSMIALLKIVSLAFILRRSFHSEDTGRMGGRALLVRRGTVAYDIDFTANVDTRVG
jgi:hypothetical protein